jgi:hypothetical protein
VASRLRAEGVDCYRGGKDQSSREKSGELSTDRKLTSACHTKPETFKLYIEILKGWSLICLCKMIAIIFQFYPFAEAVVA